jgi:Cu-Zn family superoxide dismutase
MGSFLRQLAGSALLLGGCSVAGAAAASRIEAQGALVDPTGARIGAVHLHEAPKGVLMTIEAKGLTPGWHGMHFHQTGSCTDGFKNAGGHILAAAAAGGSEHQHHDAHSGGSAHLASGLLSEKSNDAGALPNLYATSDGTAVAEVFSTFVSLTGRDGRPALLDRDGVSVIIHEGPEDQTGATDTVGRRIACAAVNTNIGERR